MNWISSPPLLVCFIFSPSGAYLCICGLNADRKLFSLLSKERLVPMTLQHHSSDTLLSSILSSYLLTDPPSLTSSLPTILTLINDRKPFLTIPSTSSVLHKWNTRVSSLIQSKTVESRYWGICLAKATIANGGEGLGHVTVWAKLLLNLLHVCYFNGWTDSSDRRGVYYLNGLLRL
jgi:hypothetical protein